MIDLDEKMAQRKVLLMILVQVFGKEISLSELAVRAKSQLGRPIDGADLGFHVAYLEGAAVAATRMLRGGKNPILMIKATLKGVQMIDGTIPPEPGLGF